MNQSLKIILQKMFCLTDAEFDIKLRKEDITRWDSLVHINLVTEIEKKYNIRFSIEEILQIDSIKDILNLLKQNGINIE